MISPTTVDQLQHVVDKAAQDKIARLEAECAALKAAFESACDFIDSHVADPDITNEMRTNYEIFCERRKLIAAMQAGDKP